MTTAVVGATGTAGSRVTTQLEIMGRNIRPLSRSYGIDLQSGEGLVDALHGVSTVIDVSNPIPDDSNLVEAMAAATSNLVEACIETGVEHLVFLSINNIDSPVFDAFPYYVAKREQERIVKHADLSTTLIRSSQWHEFATAPAVVTFHDDRIEVEDWLIQPIAVDTVAGVLIEAADKRSPLRLVTGPEHIRLPELSRAYFEAQAEPRPVRAVAPSLPELATGVLEAPAEAEQLGPTVAQWLEQQRE